MIVSIIIATLNAGKTLARCLRSVEEQHHPGVEVLIQDGGSGDETPEIVRKFASRGLDIRWRSEPDNGIYDAINKALVRATGEFIVVLGADDVLAPSALRTVADVASRVPGDIYPGAALFIYPDWQAVCKVDVCDRRAFLLHSPFCHNAMFARSSAYATVGEYDVSYRVSADMQWVHRAIRADLVFVPIEEVLVHFYCGGASSNPDVIMSEAFRLVQENFPCLSPRDAKYLLNMAKGWTGPEGLDAVLSRYEGCRDLIETARLAADYAPHCAQRTIDAVAASAWAKRGIFSRFCQHIMRVFS